MAIAKPQIFFFIHSPLCCPSKTDGAESQEPNPVLHANSSFMQLCVVLLTAACHTMCPAYSNAKDNPIVHFISIFTCCRCMGTSET